VVSDVVCPWCYIGKRRMEKAIEQLGNRFEFRVEFSPFELNPEIPPQGIDQKSYLSSKFGGPAQYSRITDHVTEVASGEGLSFDFAKQNVSPNTRDAHRIIWLARKSDQQAQVNEALMKAYFQDGIDLSNQETLIGIAVGVGMDRGKLEKMFATDEGLSEVLAAEQLNYQRGVTGVPFFIINNKYGMSGAQLTDAFVKVFTEVGGATAVAQGEACATGSNTDC
jgi:predicted DsbA family dithiol-disulfide isomerase